MSPERHPPTDPREWLNRARSSLAKARIRGDEIYLEDLCFDAQQAAEKAIKAILIARKITFQSLVGATAGGFQSGHTTGSALTGPAVPIVLMISNSSRENA